MKKDKNGIDTVWKVPGNCKSYQFDQNKLLIYETNHFDEDTMARHFFTYNENHQIVNIKSKNVDSLFLDRHYVYDPTYNLLIKEYCKLEHYVKFYSYDSLGRLSNHVNYRLSYLNNSPRIDTVKFTYEYEKSSINLIKMNVITNANEITTFNYNYDSQKNLISQMYTSSDGNGSSTYQYNDNNDVIECESNRDNYGRLIKKYEYQYDSIGNWIKKVEYLDNKKSTIQTRKIIYLQ